MGDLVMMETGGKMIDIYIFGLGEGKRQDCRSLSDGTS